MDKKNSLQLYLFGISLILLNNLAMTLQSSLIKKMVFHINHFQLVCLYKFAVLLMAVPWVLYKGIKSLKTEKIHLHMLRAFLSLTAALLYVSALKYLPVANAVAIGYTEPLFATVMAIIILKERLHKSCLIAIFIGFIGTMIVISTRMKNYAIDCHALLVLAAAVVWSFDYVVIKFLGKTEKSVQYVFFISLFSVLFSLIIKFSAQGLGLAPEYYKWDRIELSYVPWILALAGLYFIHLIAAFKALQYANLSLLAPFDFSRIIFSSVLASVFFNEQINLLVIVGSLLIVSSSVFIVRNKDLV